MESQQVGVTGISSETWRALLFERSRQYAKFGKFPLATPLQTLSILVEEVGELATEINQQDKLTEHAKNELRQIAAVAIAALDNDLHWGDLE